MLGEGAPSPAPRAPKQRRGSNGCLGAAITRLSGIDVAKAVRTSELNLANSSHHGIASARGSASARGLSSARVHDRLSHVTGAMRGVLTDFEVERRIARKGARKKLTRRDHLYLGLNSPSSSLWALAMALVLTVFTLAATASYAVSTIDGRVAQAPKVFQALDATFAVVFTCEVVLRLVAAPSVSQLATPLLILEAVCLVPLYVRLLHPRLGDDDSGSVWLRYLDALGPLRLLKLVRYYSDANLLGNALRQSTTALMVPLSLMFLLATCFGSLLFALEKEAPAEGVLGVVASPNRVQNVPDAIWMMLITMTTVGYGDFFPQTPLGRTLVSAAALSGVVIIAMPLAIIGSNFNEQWSGRDLQLMVSRLRLLLIEQHMSVTDVFAVFSAIDNDQSGTIDFAEFKDALEKLDIGLTANTLRKVWRKLDEDKNGNIDYFEFCEARGSAHAPYPCAPHTAPHACVCASRANAAVAAHAMARPLLRHARPAPCAPCLLLLRG